MPANRSGAHAPFVHKIGGVRQVLHVPRTVHIYNRPAFFSLRLLLSSAESEDTQSYTRPVACLVVIAATTTTQRLAG